MVGVSVQERHHGMDLSPLASVAQATSFGIDGGDEMLEFEYFHSNN